jgi:hypothetical protein
VNPFISEAEKQFNTTAWESNNFNVQPANIPEGKSLHCPHCQQALLNEGPNKTKIRDKIKIKKILFY